MHCAVEVLDTTVLPTLFGCGNHDLLFANKGNGQTLESKVSIGYGWIYFER